MAYKVNPDFTDNSVLEEVNKIPDICPHCGKGIEPVFCFQYGVDVWRAYDGFLQIVFRCPKKECQRLFVALYGTDKALGGGVALRLQTTYVADYVDYEKFPEIINKLSEKFSRIYNQAKIAEENGLDEVAGVGYGKALEYIIKDYFIHEEPEKMTTIKKMFLAAAITAIGEKEPRIKITAERANWIRTDETHYERRWEDKDIQDLKTLIRLTVNWIESSLLTKEYEESMPPVTQPEKKEQNK